jgi:hypothetical protein
LQPQRGDCPEEAGVRRAVEMLRLEDINGETQKQPDAASDRRRRISA